MRLNKIKQNGGAVGAGPDAAELNSDEAFEARKRYAEDLIADNRLTSETEDEKIAEIAQKAGNTHCSLRITS